MRTWKKTDSKSNQNQTGTPAVPHVRVWEQDCERELLWLWQTARKKSEGLILRAHLPLSVSHKLSKRTETTPGCHWLITIMTKKPKESPPPTSELRKYYFKASFNEHVWNPVSSPHPRHPKIFVRRSLVDPLRSTFAQNSLFTHPQHNQHTPRNSKVRDLSLSFKLLRYKTKIHTTFQINKATMVNDKCKSKGIEREGRTRDQI